MIKCIRLRPEYGEEITMDVFPGQWIYRIEDVLGSRIHVYENRSYVIILDVEGQINSVAVYLNGDRVDTEIMEDQGCLTITTGNRLFRGQIGFAQFSFCIDFADEEGGQWYYSEFASILVKSSLQNQAVSDMLKYIYDNQAIALKGEQTVTQTGEDKSAYFDDFWSQLQLLEKISGVYERSYGYFKANARYRLEPIETVDRVEKLQGIDSKTLTYIVQHPELLRRELSGIRYGRQSFLPNKTMMLQNQMTYNIYENRVVQSFIKKVQFDAEALIDTIDRNLRSMTNNELIDEGYILSSELLFQNAKEVLQGYKDRVVSVAEKLSYLSVAYSQLLHTDEEDMTRRPEPTAIFLNVPQYNQVYSCINEWFGKRGYGFKNELAVLNLFSIPDVYEIYVLLRLLNSAVGYGFEIAEKKTIKFYRGGKSNKSRDYYNVFRLTRDHEEMTIYSEPVISDDGTDEEDPVGLYRNNSILFNRDTSNERNHNVYTPDYVLKVTDKTGKVKYAVCDAKYSNKAKIRNTIVPELVFKYMFSISPRDKESSLLGMNIFYGIADENETVSSVYDKCNGNDIVPFASMLPISERKSKGETDEMIRTMIANMLGAEQ